jgi:hypothetical protein
MTTKKINRVIVYYDDGTYEEIKTGVVDSQNQPNKNTFSTPFVDLRPDYYKIKEYDTTPPAYWKPPFTVTCETGSVPLNYTITTEEPNNWKFTSTGNFAPDNKYSITSTGNGNVDISK